MSTRQRTISPRQRIARRDAGAQAVLAALLVVAATASTAGFHAVFDSWTFIAFAFVGALVAGLVSVAGAWKRLLVGEEVALAVVGFGLAGILVAGGPASFFDGLTKGWATVVSVTQPADLTAELRIVPFALAWLGALIGCEVARHVRQPAVPIVGPLVTTVLTVLLSAEEHAVALAQGAVVAALGIAVGVIQQRRLRRAGTVIGKRRRGGVLRWLPAAVMVIAITVVAPFVGPRLPLADANERYDLREHVTPPWDPLSVPSPLVELKSSLVDQHRTDVVFHVDADEPLARWQAAVLGSYDGVVWTVGSGQSNATSEFKQVGLRLPAPSTAEAGDAESVDATVTVRDLRAPWVPSPGWPTALDPLTPVTGDVRSNLRTGTVAVTGGMPADFSYNVSARPLSTADDDTLSTAHITSLPPSAQLDALPPALRNLAADIVQGKPFGWPQVMAIRDALRNEGFYDASPGVAPGHSYFRLAELLGDRRRMVGYEEQYAAAAAVLLRVAQIPTRVVVGYLVPDSAWSNGGADVHAGDISAWVEVQVDGYGWVPVDVTPPRTKTPTVDRQGTATRDVAVPDPPPPPPQPPDVQVVVPNRDDNDDKDKPITLNSPGSVEGAPGWSPLRWTVTGGSSIVLLAVLAAGGIVGVKVWRRHRRRRAPDPAARIAGAWSELADRCVDAGVPLPPQTTPLEAARAYLHTEASAGEVHDELLALVGTIDRAAYHAEPPDAGAAAAAWANCDEVVAAMVRRRHLGQRLRMHLSPRTALHRDRLRSNQ